MATRITKRIMIVDDSMTMRMMLNMTLTDAGYEVIEACNGREGLILLSESPVDMLVTDLNMPHLDGIGLATAARRLPGGRFMPIIMLTTEGEGLKKENAKSVGVSAWITKPFKAQQLLGVVRMVLH